MTPETARMFIGRQIVATVGISQPNGPYLPAGSTFWVEFVEFGSFGLSWPSPRGKLSIQLPISSLPHFVTKEESLR